MKVAIAGLTGLTIACLLLTPVLAENGLFALGLDSDQPIEISSSNFKARSFKDCREAMFEGSVKVKHEDVTLTCQKLVTILEEENKGDRSVEKPSKKPPTDPSAISNIRTITASDNVKIVQNENMATAGKAVYDNVKRTITLTETPRVWQGNIMLEAQTITVDIDKNSIEAVGGKWKIGPLMSPRKDLPSSRFCSFCWRRQARQNDFLALGEGSDQPIDIKAKKVTVRNVPNGSETVFEGTVRVKQADVVMNCDRLVVTRDDKKPAGSPEKTSKKSSKEPATLSDIRSITASGNVKIGQEERTALAGKAVFDNVKRTITLSETPRLWQGGDMMEAESIIIYLDENRAELAGKNGKEIRMQINPAKQRKEKEKSSPGQGN